MSNIQIMKQAQELYRHWEASQPTRFWLDFYTQQTGADLGDEQYDLVVDMTAEGLLS